MANISEVWEWSRYSHQELVDIINELKNHIEYLEEEIENSKAKRTEGQE